MQLLLNIPARVLLVGVLASVVLLAYAFRSEATGFTFAMGDGFNLTIDSHAIYNGVVQDGTNGTFDSTWARKDLVVGHDKFFNIDDVKPGDHGENTISFHVNKESWICLDFENLKQKENGRNEPELLEDASGSTNAGELADGTEFFAWYDDGDDVFEVGEKPIFGTSTGKQAATIVLKNKTYVLADSLAGNAFPANQTKYIGITWCAGNLEVNVAAAVITCDGTALGNVAQTDSFSVDIGFRAVPKKDNKNFRCEKNGLQCDRSGCNGTCNNSVTIHINNNGTVISNTSSNSNTGGNSAGSGGTVVTGNASSSAVSTNFVNFIRLFFGR